MLQIEKYKSKEQLPIDSNCSQNYKTDRECESDKISSVYDHSVEPNVICNILQRCNI